MAKTDEFLFDSNVLLDLVTGDPVWSGWSQAQYDRARAESGIAINPIIYAELAPAFDDEESLRIWLDPNIFTHLVLPYRAGWLASRAFLKYRRAGGSKRSPLPDFYIGAHAEVRGLTIVTRDPARFRTYFPSVRLISP